MLWIQAAIAEVASLAIRLYGVIAADLAKAFEKVLHAVLARAAARHGYPVWVLRLSLDVYRMKRTVLVEGA